MIINRDDCYNFFGFADYDLRYGLKMIMMLFSDLGRMIYLGCLMNSPLRCLSAEINELSPELP
jgi:hypothetical protein